MIGNDVIDLALAKKESNWKRNRFLDKIFTVKEQLFIVNAENPEIMVWNLWSRKEATYKIYNRETGIRGYFPLQIECSFENEHSGTVAIRGNTYFTNTIISDAFIHTIAALKKENFEFIEKLNSNDIISKTNGIPFIIDMQTKLMKPVSISHHGRFWEGITLTD
ncbi:4'-phosphopantetheinyl transferase superfamily protein [Flavobacterium sp. GT2N3]|uniref:4'-phosphopantetheinyl transferase family protein n=1 Tax=unclassified Flavobacterium TaxID=196869 RepID=UPI003AB01702